MNPQQLTAALEIVRQCGDRLLEKQAQLKSLTVRDKGLNQLVSEADVEAEEALVRGLGSILPEAAFITEEGTVAQAGEESLAWIIDPLDGTTNFLHGLPVFSVSVALARGKEILAGIVYIPALGECFHAVQGDGAFLNGQAIRVSEAPDLSQSLLATGFPYIPPADALKASSNTASRPGMWLPAPSSCRKQAAGSAISTTATITSSAKPSSPLHRPYTAKCNPKSRPASAACSCLIIFV